MSEEPANTTCPHCGSDTGILRTGPTIATLDLTCDELEALVRNEWRRRLGRGSYTRAHGTRLIGTLTRLMENPDAPALEDELSRNVLPVIADLRAEGAGWGAIRHEMAKLMHAFRTILRQAGADADTADALVQPARNALESVLGLPMGSRPRRPIYEDGS